MSDFFTFALAGKTGSINITIGELRYMAEWLYAQGWQEVAETASRLAREMADFGYETTMVFMPKLTAR